MVATTSAWLLARRALRDPHGSDYARLEALAASLADPWQVSDTDLAAAVRAAGGLAWGDLTELPPSPRAMARHVLRAGLQMTARLRWHGPFEWLLTAPATGGAPLAGEAEIARWRAVARLQPALLPAAADPTLQQCLTILSQVRRYGPAEPDVQRRLAHLVGTVAPDNAGLRGWVTCQVTLTACWVALTRAGQRAAWSLAQRAETVADSWVGWLASGRQDDALAAVRAGQAWALAQRTRLSLGVVAPLAGPADQNEAVAWWEHEAAGWRLVHAGEADAAALAAAPPGVLSGG